VSKILPNRPFLDELIEEDIDRVFAKSDIEMDMDLRDGNGLKRKGYGFNKRIWI
jgi:hypothetical protein